jgi:hypothetical protein
LSAERLSVREFARRASCDEKQVRRALEKGMLEKGKDGKLSADDVGGQWRKPNRRGVVRIARTGADKARTSAPTSGRADMRDGETPQEAAERIIGERPLLALDEALRLKENYLARHQQLSYDLKAGTVVIASEVARVVGAEYATVRTRVLAIPSSLAPAVHRAATVTEVEDLLMAAVTEALEGLTFDRAPGT